MKRNVTIKNGELQLGGVPASALAAEYGTPLYVMEEETVRRNMRAFRSSMEEFYGEGLVCYASKAFCCKEIYRIADQEGLGADVVSLGELYTAKCAGFPMEKVCFHGNNKSEEELRAALEYGVGRIVADSLSELARLSRLAGEMGRKAPVLLRIKPGIDAHTHDFIRTGQIDSKFGLALETGEAMEGVREALALPNLSLRGVHCHIGSQIFQVEPFVEAARVMMEFLGDVKEETGAELADLNLGGGFGIRYTDADEPVPFGDYMGPVSRAVRETAEKRGLSMPFVLIEPGRSIVGEAGTTLYTTGPVKEIPGVRSYLAVDGGMGDNPRYILYQAKYDMLPACRADEPADRVYTVAGKCCESGDLLGENVPLPEMKEGELLAVLSTGAYNYSMASRYNRRGVPPVVMVKDGASRLIVRGESLEDLVQNDL
ncbi:MAG TPA: diaminopimelate decarboxylase [Candidatus Merdivicinus faecavium]|nr:diaminopimelate decarboxylase [Candidatus Merdivicinus faecavium]